MFVGCAEDEVELTVMFPLRVVDPLPPTSIVRGFVDEEEEEYGDLEPLEVAILLDMSDIVPVLVLLNVNIMVEMSEAYVISEPVGIASAPVIFPVIVATDWAAARPLSHRRWYIMVNGSAAPPM